MKLPSWIPANIKFAVREACVDSDGFWIYLRDEFEVDDGSTISGDTAADAIEYFHGGTWNAALQAAWDSRAAERAKAKASTETKAAARIAKRTARLEADAKPGLPIVPGKRNPGVSDEAWNRYLARVEAWNKAVVAANRKSYSSPY